MEVLLVAQMVILLFLSSHLGGEGVASNNGHGLDDSMPQVWGCNPKMDSQRYIYIVPRNEPILPP